MKQPFAIIMDTAYIRDAQMVDTKSLTQDEFNNLDLYSQKADDLCRDIEPKHLVGIFHANNADNAIMQAAKEKHYDPRVLYVEPIIKNLPSLYIARAVITVKNNAERTYPVHGLVVACDPNEAETKVKTRLPALYADAIGKTNLDIELKEIDIVKQDSSWEGHTGMRTQFLIN